MEDLRKYLLNLHNPDQEIRQATIEEIREQADLLRPVILPLLADNDPQIRADAVMALTAIADPSTIPELQKTLDDSHWQVTRATIWALGSIGELAVPTLIEALCHRANQIGDVTGELARIGDAAIPLVVQMLQDNRPTMRIMAAHVLGRYGHRQERNSQMVQLATERLLVALRDSDSELRWAAAQALGSLGNPVAVPDLLERLHDNEYVVASHASMALSNMGTSAVSGLIEAAGDLYIDVRRNALRALASIDSPDVLPVLIKALRDDDWTVRREAVEGLERTGNPEVIPYIVHMLYDEDISVCEAAGRALGRFADPLTVPDLARTLLKLTGEAAPEERAAEAIVRTLQMIGTPEALKAIEAWRSLL